MIDDEKCAFLEGGSALIVGFLDTAGHPFATRAWGLRVLDAQEQTVRLLLDADEATPAENAPIAVTAADVPTLRTLQYKGTVARAESPADTDAEILARYCEDFYADVKESDGTSIEILSRMTPARVTPFVVTFETGFNQTPGPSAGTPMEGGSGGEPARGGTTSGGKAGGPPIREGGSGGEPARGGTTSGGKAGGPPIRNDKTR